MQKTFEEYLEHIEFRGKNKTLYTYEEKMELLTKAAPLILGGTPIQIVSAIIAVPQDTLYLWVKKVNEEGVSSIKNKKDQKTQESLAEMFKAVEWIEISGRKPTPSKFKEAVFYLRLTRKPVTLYLYYRRHITKKKEDND
jgi:hypothetical protein